MALNLAVKFAITAAVLGCATRKDLARAFARADPMTSFDLDRSYKWLQGRAQPRNPKLYREWLDLLGLVRTKDWLLDSSSEEFLAEICGQRQVQHELVWQQALDFLGADVGDQDHGSPMGLRKQLEGVFAVYSWAWSPYRHGRVIRGTLTVTQSRRLARPEVVYSETLQGVPMRMQGTTYDSGQSLFLNLLHEDGELPLFFSMVRPNPPTSVMVGHLAGASLMGPTRPPSVTRIIMLRVPAAWNKVEDGNRYLEPDEPIVPDLVGLGLVSPSPDRLEEEIQNFLRGAPAGNVDQVTAQLYAPIVELLDPFWIDRPQGAEAALPGA